MAFLCNEEKFFWTKNLPSTEHISPGFYIPQTIHRKMKKSFAPFGSSVEKKTKTKMNEIPLNHSKNIYLFNYEKNKFSVGKNLKKKNNKKKIRIIKYPENEKDLKDNLIIRNLNKMKITRNDKGIYPKIIIDSYTNTKISNNNNKEKFITESYTNYTNNFPNNKNILNKKDNKSRLSLPRIEPKSTRGLIIEQRNKRNDRIKSQRLRPNFSFDNKRISEIINNCENEKGKEMSYINQLNKKLVSLFGYDYKHSTPSRPDVANFIKKLKNIKKILNKKNEQYELDKLIIKAKMKYVDWKLGNNESEKYFTNNEFNLKEKNGEEMRKSFYKKLNLLMDVSKEEKENKKTKEKENKKTKTFYIDLKKEDEKLFKNNDQWNNDKALNLLKEQYHCLKKVKERKIKEQKNRDIIQRIIIKSRQRAFNINNS
jgi:hypothetical protein